MSKELISLLVPDPILAHFEYERLEEMSGAIRVHLTERKGPDHFPKAIIGKGSGH